MAIHVRGGVGGKEHCGASEFFRLGPAPCRGAGFDPGGKGFVFQQCGVEFGGEIAGGEGVYGYAVTTQFCGH